MNISNKMWYLAHPYTAPNAMLIQQNVISANRIAANLIHKGALVYSPITMTHYIHLQGVIDGLWDLEEQNLWYKFDVGMMERCDGIILSPGWKLSKGCRDEKQWFLDRKMPAFTLSDFIKLLDENLLK